MSDILKLDDSEQAKYPQMAHTQMDVQILPIESSRAFDRIPVEIWGTIAQALPARSLHSFVLVSWKFYTIAISHLYRTIHFFGTASKNKEAWKVVSRLREWSSGLHRAQLRLCDSDHSSPIFNLKVLFETLSSNIELRSSITKASFEWDSTANSQDILMARKCLEILKISLSLLRLSLPDFDVKLAVATNVTSLEIEYPNENRINDDYEANEYDVDLHKGLRDSVYSIFSIPTLQHLSINNARTWQAFDPHVPSDNSRVGTSNLLSLSLFNTVPLSRDLKEILTWPKRLAYICHENSEGRHSSFQNYGSEQIASPKVFIEGLYSQRHAVEELVYNNVEDCSGTDDTTFGNILKEFVKLRRLSVPRDAIIAPWRTSAPPAALYTILPYSLEQAWITIDSGEFYDDKEKLLWAEELEAIARNKQQCFPSLTTVVLWDEEPDIGLEIPRSGYKAEATRVLDALNLVSLYQEVEIRLDFKFGYPTSFERSDFMD